MAKYMLHEELIDDSKFEDPVFGLKGTLGLDDRFAYRLGQMMGATVVIRKVQQPYGLSIYVSPGKSATTTILNQRIRKFTEDLQGALRSIAISQKDSRRNMAIRELWNVVLLYGQQSVGDVVKSLEKLFEQYHERYQTMVIQNFGLDDEEVGKSMRDTELGDSLIKLHQLVGSYNGTIDSADGIVELAWSSIRDQSHLLVRMSSLLGHAFSTKLYDLIRQLGHVKRAFHTLSRAATTVQDFRTVSIHLGPAPPPTTAPRATANSSLGLMPARQPPRAIEPKKATNAVGKSKLINAGDVLRPYLSPEDQDIDLPRLQPTAKRDTAVLAVSVLSGHPPPPETNAYYEFGFATCKTSDAEHALCSSYETLLREGLHPPLIFNDLIHALQSNSLSDLLTHNNPQPLHPTLLTFLTLPPHLHPTVYRLIPFLKCPDNDEPLPCLKRDYGFKLCTNRDHVASLKKVYAQILGQADAEKLHDHCRFGRLLDFARETLGWVDKGVGRLLNNDYPAPGLGFDGEEGLEGYRGMLFNKSRKV